MSLPTHFDLSAKGDKTIKIPSVGYGTWAAGDKSWAKDATLSALKAGYRHLDCAWMYGVDGSIGAAIKESGIPREEIFVTSKWWPHFGNDVELCLDKILKGMGLDYIDLYLAHWPAVWSAKSREALVNADATAEDKGVEYLENGKPKIEWDKSAANLAKQKGEEGSFEKAWRQMEDCVNKGKTRTIGLSNFSIKEIEELLPIVGDVPISCNQIEVHPWLPQRDMLAFAKKHNILITCYSPFAGQKDDGATLLKDQAVGELAKKNNMDVGQLLQSWAVQRGTVPLGKSQTPSRIKSNLDIRKLSVEDMNALDGMAMEGDSGRTVDPREGWGMPLFKD